jgi:hypothetical protein
MIVIVRTCNCNTRLQNPGNACAISTIAIGTGKCDERLSTFWYLFRKEGRHRRDW